MSNELPPCPFCGKTPVRISVGTASCDGMVDGKEVHNTIGMRPEAWKARAEAERTAAIAAAVGDWPGDDTDALNLLAGAGYGCKAGMIYPKEPGGDESVMVCAAINYLCSEWDYGYAPSRAALERTAQ